MSTPIELQQSTDHEDKPVFRLKYGEIVSPNLRSKDAAIAFMPEFRAYAESVCMFNEACIEAAQRINAMGDKQLQEHLQPKLIHIPQ